MLDLLKGYTLSQIIVFIIMLLLAIKSVWDLVDYFIGKYNRKFKKDYGVIKEKEELDKQLNKLLENQEMLIKRCDKFDEELDKTQKLIEGVNDRVDDLTESDMYDIKYSIVQAYHHFVEDQKWIDDFSMNVLESRFKIYTQDGGNSFIENMMEKLRRLPNVPPVQ